MSFLITLSLAGALAAPVNGPTAAELAALIHGAPKVSGPVDFRLETIRSIRRHPFEDEPTEYRCRFRAFNADGQLKRHFAIVAIERNGWVLLSMD